MTPDTIGDLVEVAPVETVVRLDGRGGRLQELVLTGDVVQSLAAVLEVAGSGGGAGFFVVGPFGSGKSHFLAALGELLAEPTAAKELAGWDATMRALSEAARPSAPVAVPLVEYRAKAALEDVVWQRARRVLGDAGTTPAAGTDRLSAWDGLLDAARGQGHTGVVLLLDELSEFLRAKSGPALTEDLRFLQFLGEWATDRPVLVVGAVQESIEEVANVSQRELARIRDRYRPSLTLSMRHVEDLVRGRLVRLRPGAEDVIAQAHHRLDAAFPAWRVPADRFERCYPLHPETLTVLEGLRFLLSQQRGVVDFICRQLAGDASAGIEPWLERGRHELITPDRVYDHFRGRLHERMETGRLADSVVPYYERAVAEMFDDEADRDLAIRAVKLLCLLSASPLERPRTAAELAGMLLAQVSDIDPVANVTYLERVILEPLAARGAFVVARPGVATTYAVELEADAAVAAGNRVDQARSELSPGDRRLVATLVELGSTAAFPLFLQADIGMSRRQLLWQNTLRTLMVGVVRLAELTSEDAARMVNDARAKGAEGCLLIGEVELEGAGRVADEARLIVTGAGMDRLAIWAPAPLSPEEHTTLLDMHSRRLALAAARQEGRGDLVAFFERSSDADAAQAREILRRLYFGGQVLYPGGAGHDLPSLAGLPFERQLVGLADPLLAALHPRHREVMPRGELVGERLLRQLVTEVIAVGRIGPATLERRQLRSVIDGYLLPLGLARIRRDGATIAPDPGTSPAVAQALALVGTGEGVAALDVMQALADGPVGLTEPEALLVLNSCVQAGLLEARRGRRPLTEVFLALTAADRLGAGELVEAAVRAALAELSPLVTGPGPFEPWSSNLQGAAWEYARAWLEACREAVAQVRNGIDRLNEIPALGAADAGPLLDDVRAVGAVIDACDVGSPPPSGLRQLVATVASCSSGPSGPSGCDPAALVAASKRLRAAARFLREDLDRVEEAAAYLTHPDLTLPPGQERLTALREGALELLRDVVTLAPEDRAGEVFVADREFRRAYVATYQEAHDRYYDAVSPAQLDEIRSGATYGALARLSAVEAIAVPDNQVKVDRALSAAVPRPCRRRADVELSWKPLCTCGFSLGDDLPALDRQAIEAMAERGFRQHLAELARPEHRSQLEQAAEHLVSLGQTELAADVRRLLTLVAGPDTAEPVSVAHLLSGEVTSVLRDVLSGARLIVPRDLALLREDLIGRRYPKRRLLDLLAAWVDAQGDMPPGAFVEVVDSSEGPVGSAGLGRAASGAGAPGRGAFGAGGGALGAGGGGGTASLVARRFPGLAALLPGQHPGDAFWLAAWWAGRPGPPPWLPGPLVAEGARLAAAADAARSDLVALAELADLDTRISADSVLGDQVAAALDLGRCSTGEVATALAGERLFRYPVRLAADQLIRRLTSDWQLVDQLDDLGARLAAGHALLTAVDLAPLAHLLAAARHLARIQQHLPALTCRELVEELYPELAAPVPGLISRAELACAGRSLVDPEAIHAFRGAAVRLLRAADTAFGAHGDAGFAGCLKVWEIGEKVLAPLLASHGRVAVLLVDAMRVDLWRRWQPMISRALPGRQVEERWAVVPVPTRTAESVAALYTGRPVPAGSAPSHPGSDAVPFAHLGYDAAVVVGADRDHRAAEVRALWMDGPPISLAVATGVDERLHRTSVEVAALLDEAIAGLERRVIPALAAIPGEVPVVVLADHGFRENPTWGRGPDGRYVHGGPSLEEGVIPVVVFSPAGPASPASPAGPAYPAGPA